MFAKGHVKLGGRRAGVPNKTHAPRGEHLPIGRPTSYSEELAAEICLRIAEGIPLRSICSQDGMPDKSTVLRWRTISPAFCDQYAHAREQAMEVMGDEILEIADNASGDVCADGKVNLENVQRAKLRVDTRKWLMSKLAPKKFGDRTALEHSATGEGKLEVIVTYAGHRRPEEYQDGVPTLNGFKNGGQRE